MLVTPSNIPVVISAGTKISIKDGSSEESNENGGGNISVQQLASSMSTLSLGRLKKKKGIFGMSGLEKAYDALLEVVSYPLLYNDIIAKLNIECPKGNEILS
jgi:transitional endoplasmic reticulum ATPase